MGELSNPHDRFFKATFGRPDVAADFLAHHLPPAVSTALDLSAPELSKDSFLDLELREHSSDLLYRVRLKRGGPAYVYLLFEHKSTPEELVAFQLLRYKVRIWEPLTPSPGKRAPRQKLPPIFPLVIYHGRRRWRVARNFGALIEWDEAGALRPYVAEFEYYLLDLSTFSEAQIVGAAVARVGLLALKYAFDGTLIRRLPELARHLPIWEQSALEYFATVLRYVSETNRKLNAEEFAALKEQLPAETGDVMETMAEAWIKEGMQKGLRQGRQEGRQEGVAAFTLGLLQDRLGEVDARLAARLHELSIEQLEALVKVMPAFRAPRDLAAWLRAQTGKA